MRPPKQVNVFKLFMFGYWGWGEFTNELDQATAAVEKSRGYGPPEWADARLHRNVRAEGFNGNKFMKAVKGRYRWWKGLGNRFATDPAGRIEIAHPNDAENLLERVLKLASDQQRAILFCSCRYPYPNGRQKPPCHRSVVAGLLLAEAARRAVQLEVVEWPGGTPGSEPMDLRASKTVFESVRTGRLNIPIRGALADMQLELVTAAGLSWGTVVRLHYNDQHLHRIVGPARCRKSKEGFSWVLPVLVPAKGCYDEPNELIEKAAEIRYDYGFDSKYSF